MVHGPLYQQLHFNTSDTSLQICHSYSPGAAKWMDWLGLSSGGIPKGSTFACWGSVFDVINFCLGNDQEDMGLITL